MSLPVLIARCPVHGLHGEREECFVCGATVDHVAMVPFSELRDAEAASTAAEATLARVRNALAALDGQVQFLYGALQAARDSLDSQWERAEGLRESLASIAVEAPWHDPGEIVARIDEMLSADRAKWPKVPDGH